MACTRRGTYLSLIITIVPLWITSTIFIVFLLLFFHKSLRSTKVYDNCTKKNGHYIYFVEIRTGNSSPTYNGRKTTITIDLFDDNQSTLAHIAIPGYLIFGRKVSPIAPIDDDRYPDLHVTRFWLYRSTRFRKISSIRVSHNCNESDARIMVFGVEIRSTDKDIFRTFFPVMTYISSYGPTNKPNAIFEPELNTSISAIGGSQIDSFSLTKKLSWLDYSLLVHVLLSIILALSRHKFFQGLNDPNIAAVHEGLLIGSISFVLVFLLALFLRFIIKGNYALNMGTGPWATIYFSFFGIILTLSTSAWIYNAVSAYKDICPSEYTNWIITLSSAIGVTSMLTVLTYMISWLIFTVFPKNPEPIFHEENSGGHELSSRERPPSIGKASGSRPQSSGIPPTAQATPTTSWPQTLNSNQPPPYMSTAPPYQPPPNPYPQPPPIPPALNLPVYKTMHTALAPPYGYEMNQSAGQNSSNQPITYAPQTTTSSKATKKMKSTESTGSTYYHQLMKNKGGVKSISQYGELMKQKKTPKPNKNTKAK